MLENFFRCIQRDRSVVGVKNYIIYVYFDKIFVRYCKIYVIYSKVNFITNMINSTQIHTFYFYNNIHTFINTDIIFTTKYINFIKINTSPVVGPKCFPVDIPPKIIKLISSTYSFLFTCVFTINVILLI